MSQTKILQINNGVINSYPEFGNLFSMIDLEDEAVWEWIYCNFIQIMTFPNGFTTFKDHWMILRSCPYLQSFSYSIDAIDHIKYESIKELIIKSIDNGYYIIIPVNYYYIESSPFFKKQHFLHPIFVYGYDLEENTALISDNIEEGKYIRTRFSLDDFDEAYQNFDFRDGKDSLDIVIYKRFKSRTYKFDINYLRKELELYMNPYYINVLEVTALNLESVVWENHLMCSEEGLIDIRPFSIFYEHKILMELRVKYLMEKCYIRNERLLHNILDLKDQYFAIRNIALRFNMKPSQRLIYSLKENLRQAAEQEKHFMELLLSEF